MNYFLNTDLCANFINIYCIVFVSGCPWGYQRVDCTQSLLTVTSSVIISMTVYSNNKKRNHWSERSAPSSRVRTPFIRTERINKVGFWRWRQALLGNNGGWAVAGSTPLPSPQLLRPLRRPNPSNTIY